MATSKPRLFVIKDLFNTLLNPDVSAATVVLIMTLAVLIVASQMPMLM